jgi:hypothetical protein
MQKPSLVIREQVVDWQRQLNWMTFAGIVLVVAPVAWLMAGRKTNVDGDADATKSM